MEMVMYLLIAYVGIHNIIFILFMFNQHKINTKQATININQNKIETTNQIVLGNLNRLIEQLLNKEEVK